MSLFHLVQTELVWEDADANRQALASLTDGLSGGAIVLPEMFSTGFSMASDRLAETMESETVSWMQKLAEQRKAAVCGSLIIEDQGQYFNRFIWAESLGGLVHYDKRHLFRMANEHRYYAQGTEQCLVDWDGIKINPQICYDLRFPAWSRNTSGEQVLLYVANWPAARRDQWLALLKARAIENLSYVVAVNRIGIDGNGVEYSGDSCVIDFKGETIVSLGDGERIESVELDMASLDAYRKSFPAYLDGDEFTFTR